MRIQHNIAAINAQRHSGVVDARRGKSIEKLSSGYRVNRAADDAAGLAISEKMRSQIRGLAQASRNIQDGISLVQIADGAMQIIHDIIQRMRELTVQAASDTNVRLDREAIQKEIAALTSEINHITSTTEFNTRKLFDGSINPTYGWYYGVKDSPLVSLKDPAVIYADSDFQEVRVPRGSQASQSISSASGSLSGTVIASNVSPASSGTSHLGFLDGPPPTYPLEGVFIIRITDPLLAPGGVNFILDFEVENAAGDFTSDDFQAFFQNAFDNEFGEPGSPPTQGATITITNGAISVQTHGLGGSSSSVIIGATNSNTGVNMPTGTVFVNSAIFGARFGGSSVYDYYRTTGTRAITPAELTAIRANPGNSTLLWDLVPDSTVFSWSVLERTYNPDLGPPTSSSSYGPASTIYTFSISKANLISSSGATTFAQANAYLATLNDGVYFSSVTLGTPSVFTNRAGTPYINWNPGATRIINDPTLPYRYQTGIPADTAVSNTNAATASTSVTSTYPVRIPDESGLLTISIGGVNTSASATTTRSITIDFSDPMWNGATPQDLVNYINTQLNAPAFQPVPPPLHTNAAYNPARPVATASLDSNGRLVITPAERSFSVTVEERVSDRPMFMITRSAISGTNWTPTINIRNDSNVLIASVPILAADYSDIDEFIAANQAAFRSRGFTLSNDDGRLVITSIAVGEDVTVGSVSISGNTGHDWNKVFDLIGLEGLPSENFVNGVTYPPGPLEDNSLWIQSGANSGQGLYIGIPSLNAQNLGLMLTAADMSSPGSYSGISTVFGTAQYTNLSNVHIPDTIALGHGLDVMSHEKASAALSILDNAINIISEERAQLGAISNRLEFTRNNVDNAHENQSAAESRIRDTDMAMEYTKLVKEQILSQSATLMLAHANALPQGVLQLLQ